MDDFVKTVTIPLAEYNDMQCEIQRLKLTDRNREEKVRMTCAEASHNVKNNGMLLMNLPDNTCNEIEDLKAKNDSLLSTLRFIRERNNQLKTELNQCKQIIKNNPEIKEKDQTIKRYKKAVYLLFIALLISVCILLFVI